MYGRELSLLAWCSLVAAGLAPAQTVQLSHDTESIQLQLPSQNQLRIERDGSVRIARGPQDSRLLVSIDSAATTGNETATLAAGNFDFTLADAPVLEIQPRSGPAATYDIDEVRPFLAGALTSDNWQVRNNQIYLQISDSSKFDEAQIRSKVPAIDAELAKLGVSLNTQNTSWDTQVNDIYASVNNLEGERYAPTRDYLNEQISRLNDLQRSGNLAAVRAQINELRGLANRAPNVISVKVQSTTPVVEVSLYAKLDSAPRAKEFTNGTLFGIVPGRYRLEAKKQGYTDASPLTLDIFVVRPKLIECTMVTTADPPSVCRIKEML